MSSFISAIIFTISSLLLAVDFVCSSFSSSLRCTVNYCFQIFFNVSLENYKFSLSAVFATSHTFCYIVFSFSFTSKYFQLWFLLWPSGFLTPYYIFNSCGNILFHSWYWWFMSSLFLSFLVWKFINLIDFLNEQLFVLLMFYIVFLFSISFISAPNVIIRFLLALDLSCSYFVLSWNSYLSYWFETFILMQAFSIINVPLSTILAASHIFW